MRKLGQRLIPKHDRPLDQPEIFRRIFYLWCCSLVIRLVSVFLGKSQLALLGAGTGFVFKLFAVVLLGYLNYQWIKRLSHWMRPTLSSKMNGLRLVAYVGIVFLIWNRFRFGLIQDGLYAACHAGATAMISSILAEIPFWHELVTQLAALTDNSGETRFIERIKNIEMSCRASVKIVSLVR